MSRCLRSGRHGPETPQLLFGALRGILVQLSRAMELGDEDRVRLTSRCVWQPHAAPVRPALPNGACSKIPA